jgi:hypothetical protein
MTTHSVETSVHIPAEIPPNIDLVSKITELMIAAGHSRPEAWKERLHESAYDLNFTDDYRRFLINRQLRMLLADVAGEDTMDIRYCLVDQGDINRWLALVTSEVIPCILRHNLPLVKN